MEIFNLNMLEDIISFYEGDRLSSIATWQIISSSCSRFLLVGTLIRHCRAVRRGTYVILKQLMISIVLSV